MNKSLFLLLSLFYTFLHSQNYSGGSGTVNDPYLISNLTDLKYLSEHNSQWSYNFLQTANIDAAITSTWNNGQGFNPIGGTSTSFYGTYDGGGYNITGLYISRTSNMYVGMFGTVYSSGTLKNINLIGGYFYGDMYIGSLAGETLGIVTNCTSSATVKAGKYAGGLIGIIKNGITNSSATGNVTSGPGYSAGGLAASASGNVSNCFATGIVKGSVGVGGLLGASSGNVTNCYATGKVTKHPAGGSTTSGGLIGYASNLVSGCYATGEVDGDIVGGLIGNTSNNVTKSYAKGNVSAMGTGGTTYVGGLIGIISHATATAYFSNVSLSFSTGTVTGSYAKGGLIGYCQHLQEINVTNCYSRSNVPGGDGGLIGGLGEDGAFITTSYATGALGANAGGLIGGGTNVNFTNAFWDRETTGALVADASGFNQTNGGKTTSQMKTQGTFTNWDFANVWAINPAINDGYPYLKENTEYLSTNELSKNDSNITVYPTIVNDLIYISSDVSIIKYSVFDMQGRLTIQNTPNSKEFSINLSNLQQGTYLLNLIHQKGFESKKIIKK
ncbi:GLUG motif-containing protein [Chryseobacterium sp. MMS23-Vi53]|uniref:GLUG motif-containing protein n=1 Tax=Chryseobacterium sp. MMS23-Vi53 TaxID=3386644 RepID=UPI0039E8D1E8